MLIYRRDIKDGYIVTTRTGFNRLKKLHSVLLAKYNAAKIYIDNLGFKSHNVIRELLIGCGVYFDTIIRQSQCNGCRESEMVDPCQNIHACAFETTEHKHSRARSTLSMISPYLIRSILASNGIQPITYDPREIERYGVDIMTRRIAAYNVTQETYEMIRVHNLNNYYVV